MYFLYLVIAILFFGVLIAVHEFGHFMVAKMLGVKVNEFSIGMGPLLLRKETEKTVYSLRALPIGGFCAMEGEDEDTGDPQAFAVQPGWKKFLILVAGSGMNFLMGLILCTLIMMQTTAYTVPVITELMDGFPDQGQAGLMVGDEIVSIDGQRIYLFEDVSMFLSRSDGAIDLVVRRDGKEVELKDYALVPAEYEYQGETRVRYGLVFDRKEANFLDRLYLGWSHSIDFVRLVFYSLSELVHGNAGLQDMSGVIGIVDTISTVGAQSQSFAMGFVNIVYWVSFIAVNLAVMNLLPIPALDGGRIFFLLVNGIFTLVTKKRIDPRYEGYVHTAGFVLLLALMAVIAVIDVRRLLS